MNDEIKANIEFINGLYAKGIKQTIKNAAPYPDKLYYCKGKCRLVAVTKNAILIETNTEPQHE